MPRKAPSTTWGSPGRGIGISINLLIVVSIVVFVAAFTMFSGLKERQRGLSAQARENVVWSAFQGRIEVKDLIESLVLAMEGQRSLDEVGGAAPLVDWCSMRHETQYTRLFRS